MKFLKITTLLVVSSMLMATHCCPDGTTGEVKYFSTPHTYSLFYENKSQIELNNPTELKSPSSDREQLYTDGGTTNPNAAIEVRRSNGWSNIQRLNGVKVLDYHPEMTQYDYTELSDCDFIYRMNVESTFILTPPTFLHLCLNSVADVTPRENIASKSWGITAIVDENDVDKMQDPNWTCLADNQYTFTKKGTVLYAPGSDKCDGEEDLNTDVTINYVVSAENPRTTYNPGDITLTISAPGIFEDVKDVEFIIESSSFNEIKGWTTNDDGETVLVTMEPL